MLGPKSSAALRDVFAMIYFLGKKGSAKRPELSKFVVWYRNTQSQADADDQVVRITDTTISRQLTNIKNIFGIRLSQSKNFGVSIVHWGFINRDSFYEMMEGLVDLRAYTDYCAKKDE